MPASRLSHSRARRRLRRTYPRNCPQESSPPSVRAAAHGPCAARPRAATVRRQPPSEDDRTHDRAADSRFALARPVPTCSARRGVAIEVVPARGRRGAIKAAMQAEGAPARDIADRAGRAEGAPDRASAARPAGARRRPGAGLRRADLRQARRPRRRRATQLRALRGRTHDLLSAAVVFEGGRPVWRHVGRAQLTMRPFSDAFLDALSRRAGRRRCSETVGAYRLEAGGAQLFSRVQGDSSPSWACRCWSCSAF